MSEPLDPVLLHAARTLRAASIDVRPAPGTRDAIVSRVVRHRKRRWMLTTSLAVLVTLLSVPAAWAASHPADVARWWRRTAHPSAAVLGPISPAPLRAIASAAQTVPVRPSPSAIVTVHEQVPVVVSDRGLARDVSPHGPTPTRLARTTPPRGARSEAPPRIDVAATEAPEPMDRDLALYSAGHDAHFLAHDPAAALAAWDRYLAEEPLGRFVPEARYNRALTLLRLGRRDEGFAALRPFADGAYGAYRQREAQAIVGRAP